MDFAIPSHLVDTLAAVDRLLAERIIPAEAAVLEQGFVKAAPLLAALRAAVQAAGLWGPQIPKDAGGMGLGLVDHALVSERIGRSPLGHYAFGCQAPDAGNLEVLHKWGTAEQKARWMAPLAKGELRSCLGAVDYLKVEESATFQKGLAWVLEESRNATLCLFCGEADPLTCHRHHLVGQNLIARGIRVRHIHLDGSADDADPDLFHRALM